jgi:hypothetical protein
LQNPISFFNFIILVFAVFTHFSCVTHHKIAVSNGMHFINPLSFGQIIELAKQLIKKLINLLRPFNTFRKSCKSYHVSVK